MTAVAARTTPVGPGPLLSKVGEQIFVYNHLRTNQTLYSLRRHLRNKDAMRQLTFLGKKSVPAALRKDVWSPLCVLSFPSPEQGLDAYNKLRQFKIRHETEWDPVTMIRKTGPGAGKALVSRKQKTKTLQNQKANSIADMAHVLFMQTRPPTEQEVTRAEWRTSLPTGQLSDGITASVPNRPKFGKGSKLSMGDVLWRGSVKGVKIHWTDLLDAEFAETWPEDVLHGTLNQTRYTAVWPPTDHSNHPVREEMHGNEPTALADGSSASKQIGAGA